MKRGLLGFPLFIFLIQFVSAQFFGGYGGFSLRGFFDAIDPETMTLSLLFLIFFMLLFYILSKVFKTSYGEPNKGVAGTISIAISLLIVYGIYRSGFYIGDLFYGLGFSSDFLYTLLPIIILIFSILIIWGLGRKKDEFGKKRFSLTRGLGSFLIVFGLFLILLTIFTDIFYEKDTAAIIGIVLVLIGLFLLWLRRRKRRKKLTGYYGDYGPSPRGPRGPGMFSRWKGRRRELSDIKFGKKKGYIEQKAEREYQRKLHDEEVMRRAKNIKKIRKRREKAEKKRGREPQQIQETTYKEMEKQQAEQIKKQRKQQQQELTERQQKREKARKAGLREINRQLKVINRQLRNPNISEYSRNVLRQRVGDLLRRREVFKRYGIGKGNI